MKMIIGHHSTNSPRSDGDLAQIVINVAEATQVDSIILITETGALAQSLFQLASHFRLITTTNRETYRYLLM